MPPRKRKILLVRSAFLGDFVVILPQLMLFLRENNLSYDDITLLIFNKEKVNPTSLIFGADSPLAKNTEVIQNAGFLKTFFSLLRSRKKLGRFEKIIYLNYTIEVWSRKFFKTLLLRILWPNAKKERFQIRKRYGYSQYLTPFGNLEIKNIHEKGLYNWFINQINPVEINVPKVDLRKNEIRIGIYCNGKMAAKIWPMENYINLIRDVNRSYTDVSFILIGAKEDRVYNEKVRILLLQDDISNVINVAGELSIPATVAYLKGLTCLVTNDGLPVHLSAIANCPTVGLYTYRENPGAWEPTFMEKFIGIRTDVLCKECNNPYCPNPVCLTYTKYQTVSDYVKKIIDSKTNINESVILYSGNSFLNYKNG